ncbi:MAG TPA: ankyrin repeat domain-containing protein, partial [Gemmataceae bacterium]|nr:ankyrin repeat domain-containing protein [Gemmataceae bacterium]
MNRTNLLLCLAFVTLTAVSAAPPAPNGPPDVPPVGPNAAPLVGQPRPVADEDYQNAQAAAVRLFAENGELIHLRAILEKHPKLVDARDPLAGRRKPLGNESHTPLHLAVVHGHSDVVEYLIQRGADVNADSGGGWTPLHLAARTDRLDIVKLLVESGAKVDAK